MHLACCAGVVIIFTPEIVSFVAFVVALLLISCLTRSCSCSRSRSRSSKNLLSLCTYSSRWLFLLLEFLLLTFAAVGVTCSGFVSLSQQTVESFIGAAVLFLSSDSSSALVSVSSCCTPGSFICFLICISCLSRSPIPVSVCFAASPFL